GAASRSTLFPYPALFRSSAHCRASLHTDDATCAELWERFRSGPEPVGYDPTIIHAWKDGPRSPAFAALRLDPWRVRVQPAPVLLDRKSTRLNSSHVKTSY